MKTSVPICINTLNEENLPIYSRQIKEIGADRVFICFLEPIFLTSSIIYKNPEKISRAIASFRSTGAEVGLWIGAFGHGRPLYSNAASDEITKYTPILGLDDKSTPYGVCPLDESFANDYVSAVKVLAALGPDLIMLDDDFRFLRGNMYLAGCFCEKHMKDYTARIGHTVKRGDLIDLIFTGGKNLYRDAYMDMLGDTLIDFSKKLRQAVDSVNPEIRLGACSVRESLDYDGTSPAEIARALAGNTKPYTRISGAPYGITDIISATEFARMQFHALSSTEIESMSEGDVYPRPRYSCPSKALETYNLILSADGNADGTLDYIFDYNYSPNYETGYVDRYVEDKISRELVSDLFKGKKSVGVRVYNKQHKIREWDLPSPAEETRIRKLGMTAQNPAAELISKNSIPTTYGPSDYPNVVLGENARGIDRSVLSHGAIIDAVAAKLLLEQGIDTGLLSASPITAAGEYFPEWNDTSVDVERGGAVGMKVKPGATVLSTYVPDQSVASYSYTNDLGENFLVLGYDSYRDTGCPNFVNSYYRQAQLIDWIEARGKKLPAVSAKNPSLYVIASAKGESTSVLLINMSMDDIRRPVIRLDKKYSGVRFVGTEGTLDGDLLRLRPIPAFGFAAFELTPGENP